MSEKTEALRLAEQLEAIGLRGPVAAELRRLSAVEAQRDALLEACQTLVGLPGTEDWQETLRKAVQQARAAIKAVEEEA